MDYNLSIILVSWNVRDLLAQCLRSIAEPEDSLSVEVILVDNGSTDGTTAMVQKDFPWVKLIPLDWNSGFAIGNNVGIKASSGRYVILLNTDTIVPASTFARMVDFMEQHPEVGASGPRLVHPNSQIQAFAFGSDPTLSYLIRRGANRLVWRRALHNWHTDQIQAVDWVAGTALLVRRQAVEAVGLLDENIYIYFEDNDWCLRIRQAGWKIYYNPQVSIIHFGGQSISKNPNPAARNAYYNSLKYFYSKHYSPLAQLLLRIALGAYRLLVRY